MLDSISIFIPAYNEEENLSYVCCNILDYLRKNSIDYELLLLNDASSDNTLDIMRMFSSQDYRIKYFNFSTRQGLGKLMKMGYSLATKQWVMMIAGDGQFTVEQLDLYINNSDKAEIIAGYRVERYKYYPFLRRVVSKTYNFLARFFFKIPLNDIGWTKMVKRKVLEKFSLKKSGATIELELVVKALLKNFNVCEIEVPFTPRRFGKSKSFNIKVLFLSTSSILSLFIEVILLRRFLDK